MPTNSKLLELDPERCNAVALIEWIWNCPEKYAAGHTLVILEDRDETLAGMKDLVKLIQDKIRADVRVQRYVRRATPPVMAEKFDPRIVPLPSMGRRAAVGERYFISNPNEPDLITPVNEGDYLVYHDEQYAAATVMHPSDFHQTYKEESDANKAMPQSVAAG